MTKVQMITMGVNSLAPVVSLFVVIATTYIAVKKGATKGATSSHSKH